MHGTCICIEPSQYRHLGSVHEVLRRIQAIHPNPEGGAAAMQHCLITASRRTANARSCALDNKAPRQWPCADSERVSHIDWQRSITYFKGSQQFVKWSFVLVYPTSLIQHKSKYSIIFPYLRCNISECETIIYYVNDRLCTSVTFQCTLTMKTKRILYI